MAFAALGASSHFISPTSSTRSAGRISSGRNVRSNIAGGVFADAGSDGGYGYRAEREHGVGGGRPFDGLIHIVAAGAVNEFWRLVQP
jgi:hypothetical protein